MLNDSWDYDDSWDDYYDDSWDDSWITPEVEKKVTVDELKSAVDEYDEKNEYPFGWSLIESGPVELSVGTATKVDESEMREGEIWMVFKVGNQTFRIEGYWDSWGGNSSLDSFTIHEVESYQEVVTKWKKK